MGTERKRTVLIVDNDRFLTEVLSDGLKNAGYATVVAYGGHEAFNIVQTFPVDVVVAALGMAKGNGWELLARIRELNPKYPSVILLTSSKDVEEMSEEEIVDAGGFCSLPKQGDISDLLSSIDFAILQQIQEKSYHERSATRTETALQAEILIPGLDRFRLVEVVNLSGGGFGFMLRGAITHVGTVVTFRLQTKDRKIGSIEGFGVVRWTAKDQKRPKDILVGVQFINPDTETLERVNKILAEIDSSNPAAKKAG